MHIDLLHFENNFVLLEQFLLQPLNLLSTKVDLLAEIVVRKGSAGLFHSMIKSLGNWLHTVLERLVMESPFSDFSLREVRLENRERERWL